jgi:hypothetical protein
VGAAYPLPDITEILDQLGQSKYFSCLDTVMGYQQIELEDDIENGIQHEKWPLGVPEITIWVKHSPSYISLAV